MASDTHRPVLDPIFFNVTSAGIYPASTTQTGTISSSGVTVTGTGTAFLTELRKGDYIWVQNQVRKIVGILNDTKLTLNAAFSPDIAGQALKTVRHVPNVKLSVSNTDSVTAYLGTITNDAQVIEPGQTVNFESDNGMGPIAYNPNGGTLNISNGEGNMSAEVTIVGAPNVNVLSVIPGTGATNLGKAEDSVAASGDTGVFSLGVANEAQSTLAADGDYIGRAADTKGNTIVTGPTAANTARTTATKVVTVQNVDASGNVLPASPVLGAGSAMIGKVSGLIDPMVSGGFTRPNDTNAYVAYDVINDATGSATNESIAGVATENLGSGYLTVLLMTSSTAITPAIRIHFYNAAPTTAKNDNAAWTFDKTNDATKYLGYIDMPALQGGVSCSQFKSYKAAAGSTTLYYELQTLSPFTPVALSTWAVQVIPDQNKA